ncbi:hypothetical protein BDC45DRAFT_572696 [Circinella umbellata]|nr:hypothetical protein BDC45DRAFT_572696 [Circinella umbellata]
MSQQQQHSYILMMSHHLYQGIPVTPVEAMILAKLDRLESKVDLILASKDQAGEALEEPVEEAGDDEPPVEFIHAEDGSLGQPCQRCHQATELNHSSVIPGYRSNASTYFTLVEFEIISEHESNESTDDINKAINNITEK